MMELIQQIAVSGIIMPSNWDATGRIIGIALYTSNEDVYAVEHNSLTEKLMNFMHQRVEVKGKIRENPGGRKTIAVYSYLPLK